MKRQINRQRLFVNSWYIGGNKLSEITRRPQELFSNKEQLIGKTYKKRKLRNGKFSAVLRSKYSVELGEEKRQINTKLVFTLFIAIVITILFLKLIAFLIDKYYFN